MMADQLAPPNKVQTVSGATKALVERLLALGNSGDEKYRKLCYAAASDRFCRFLYRDAGKIDNDTAAMLRKQLLETLTEIERNFVPNQVSNGATIDLGPLAISSPTFPAVEPVVAKGLPATPDVTTTPQPQGGGRLKRFAIAALTGMSAALLLVGGLQSAGAIYIQRQTETVEKDRSIDDAMAKSRGIADRSLIALQKIESKLKDAMAADALGTTPEVRRYFINVQRMFPDLVTELWGEFPNEASLIAQITKDGKTGYKILVESEVCAAVAVDRPEVVDPVRNSYGRFCRFYGLWNDAGKRL